MISESSCGDNDECETTKTLDENCDDGNECTVDECTPVAAGCSNVDKDNGVDCNGVLGKCQDGDCVSVPDNGLVSWWKFDGDYLDSIGGNGGTANGGASIDDGGLVLNGVDGYVKMDSDSVLDLEGATLSWWMKRDQSRYDSIFSRGMEGYAALIEVDKSDNTIFIDGDINNNIGPRIDTDIDISDGSWHYYTMVFTKNIDKNNIELYVDGDLKNTFSGGTWVPTLTLRYIGYKQTDGYGQFFNGVIDDVMIYDRALSESEVASLYESQKE